MNTQNPAQDVSDALTVVNDAANDARHRGDYDRANALVRARVTLYQAARELQQPPVAQGASDVDIAKAQNCIHKLGSALPNLCLRCGWDWYKNGDIPEHPEEAAARELQQAQVVGKKPSAAWQQAYKEIAATPLSEIKGDLYQAVKKRSEEIEAATPQSSAPVVGDAYAPVFAELERAVQKFPTWPTDPLHAAGVLNEEVGEMNKAILQAVYEPHKSGPKQVREEAVQVAAMALRFFYSLDQYEYRKGVQHSQRESALTGRG